MLNLKIDTQSHLKLIMPESDEAIITLAERYVAYESSLPAAEQLTLPPLATIQELLGQAQTAVGRAKVGERQRALAADQFAQALAEAQANLNLAVRILKALHRHNLATLELWGVDTVQRQHGTAVRLPRSLDGWLSLMDTYVSHERTLPPEKQLHIPTLAEMTALNERLQTSYRQRGSGYSQRLQGNESRRNAVARLYLQLQLAAAVLVIHRYGGELTIALSAWGFDVKYNTSTASNSAAAAVDEEGWPAASEAAAPALESVAAAANGQSY